MEWGLPVGQEPGGHNPEDCNSYIKDGQSAIDSNA